VSEIENSQGAEFLQASHLRAPTKLKGFEHGANLSERLWLEEKKYRGNS